MALSTQHRTTIYGKLAPILGPEEARALLDQFPTTEREQPATEGFVRAEVGILRGELHREIGLLRSEMHEQIGALRSEMHSLFRRQTMWFAGLLISAITLSTAINALVVSSLR